MGKMENRKGEDVRREISNTSLISEGQDSLSPLPTGTELQLRALCILGVCLEPEGSRLQQACQLSRRRENSLVWRRAREARAPSTIPSAIPTEGFFPSIH